MYNMGNTGSYSNLELPTSAAAGDRLPVQLAVLDEDVPAVIARIASKCADPFDKLEIIDDGLLDISWMIFGWGQERSDFYGGGPDICCCYTWDYEAPELPDLRSDWGSMEIPKDRQTLIPGCVLQCITKLLDYLGNNGIPATVCIAHHFIIAKGDFLQHEHWPFPLHGDGEFKRIGMDIIKQTRQLIAWLQDKAPSRFNAQQLMENVRRLGNTPKVFLGFGLGLLLFADLFFCGAWGLWFGGRDGRLRLQCIFSGAGFHSQAPLQSAMQTSSTPPTRASSLVGRGEGCLME